MVPVFVNNILEYNFSNRSRLIAMIHCERQVSQGGKHT